MPSYLYGLSYGPRTTDVTFVDRADAERLAQEYINKRVNVANSSMTAYVTNAMFSPTTGINIFDERGKMHLHVPITEIRIKPEQNSTEAEKRRILRNQRTKTHQLYARKRLGKYFCINPVCKVYRKKGRGNLTLGGYFFKKDGKTVVTRATCNVCKSTFSETKLEKELTHAKKL